MAKSTRITSNADDGLFTPGEWRIVSPTEAAKLRKALDRNSAAKANLLVGEPEADPSDDHIDK